MLIGKNSWKGMLLLVYVALTLVASIGCFLHGNTFFAIIGVLLLISNSYIACKSYKALQEMK